MTPAIQATPGTRILVVDDEPGVRMTLAANLELEGFEVREAQSAAQALELARQSKFDLMLTDIRMPGMHGVDLYREIHRENPDMPVIAMTAFALEELVSQGIEEGLYSVVYKPFSMDTVLQLVARAVSRRGILVVDDMPAMLATLTSSLGAIGLASLTAESGAQALHELGGKPVDVCVVDLVMPGMNGAELCARVNELDPGIGLLTMTGYDAPELATEAFRNGSYVCLKKPFDLGALLKAVVALRRKLAAAAAGQA